MKIPAAVDQTHPMPPPAGSPGVAASASERFSSRSLVLAATSIEATQTSYDPPQSE
jgi:hypothetical protein